MKTFIGFNQGQYGDLFINLTACRLVKKKYPNCKLIFSVNEEYKDAIEILKLSEDIDDFIIWENYANWPSESDKKKLQKLIQDGHRGRVFIPLPKHTIPDWYNYWHQTEEVCRMHQLMPPNEEEMRFNIPKPDLEKEKTITLCTARRADKEEKRRQEIFSFSTNPKALELEQIEMVKKFAQKKGLKVIQIGGPEEEGVEGVERFEGDYSESVLKVLKSQFLVAADTGMVWGASAFSHPVVGLYSWSYYANATSCMGWIAKNANQISIQGENMRDITAPMVEEAMTNLYNKNY